MEKPYINCRIIDHYSNPDYTTKDVFLDMPIWGWILNEFMEVTGLLLMPVVAILRCLYELLVVALLVPKGVKKRAATFIFSEYIPDTMTMTFWVHIDFIIAGKSEYVYNKARDAVAQHWMDQQELFSM